MYDFPPINYAQRLTNTELIADHKLSIIYVTVKLKSINLVIIMKVMIIKHVLFLSLQQVKQKCEKYAAELLQLVQDMFIFLHKKS